MGVAAVTVMRSPGRNTSSRPVREAVADNLDLAGDDIDRALLGVRIERQACARCERHVGEDRGV